MGQVVLCRVKYLAHWAVYASVGHLGLNELTAGIVASLLGFSVLPPLLTTARCGRKRPLRLTD